LNPGKKSQQKAHWPVRDQLAGVQLLFADAKDEADARCEFDDKV
jgi:hypothetical protein